MDRHLPSEISLKMRAATISSQKQLCNQFLAWLLTKPFPLIYRSSQSDKQESLVKTLFERKSVEVDDSPALRLVSASAYQTAICS